MNVKKSPEHNYRNPARDTRIATKEDVIAIVAFGCLAILLLVILAVYTRFANLYTGIGVLAAYLLLLTLWAARRMKVDPIMLDNSMLGLLTSPLGELIGKLHSPALICDEYGNLCWYNAELTPWLEGKGAALGSSINSLFDVDEEQHRLTVNDRVYSYDAVGTECEGRRYVLIVLKDVTDLVSLEETYDKERVVVAFVSLDNIEEVIQNVHENLRDAVADVDEKLRHWVDKVGGIIKSYDNDKYILFFDSADLDEFIRNRFEILDRVRSTHIGDGISVTISMGVARVSGSLAVRQEAAQAALDLALQRGGDQVVYKYEGGIEYYGGRTKAVYKRTNVRSRMISKQLCALIARADNVIIMGHRFADFDAFGAAIGVAKLCQGCGVRPTIAIDAANESIRNCFQKASELADLHGMFVGEKEALDSVKRDTLLVVVDVNNFSYTEFPSVFERVESVAVIDHHIQTTEFPSKVKLDYIEPSASSASELVCELLEFGSGTATLRKEEAELMLAGILLDTKHFTRNTGVRTYSAAHFLGAAGADPVDTNDLFRVDADSFYKESRFIGAIQIYRGNIALSCVEGDTDQSYRVIAAQSADKMLSINKVEAAFALVKIEGTTYISARSKGTINVQLILEKMSGGGHFDVAGAQVSEEPVQSVLSQVKRCVDEYFAHP